MTTILIVEDEARIAAFVAKGLRAAGFVPEIYSTGSEAVEAALQGRGALMLLDVGLPDIDGFEVLEQIRGQGVGMPVIMLTARSSVADRVAGLEGGADDYVPKPFSFEELLARVRLRLREETPTSSAMNLHAASGTGAQPRAAALGRVGHRLRWRVQCGGRVPVLPSPKNR